MRNFLLGSTIIVPSHEIPKENTAFKYQLVKVSPGGSSHSLSRPLSRSLSCPVLSPVSLPGSKTWAQNFGGKNSQSTTKVTLTSHQKRHVFYHLKSSWKCGTGCRSKNKKNSLKSENCKFNLISKSFSKVTDSEGEPRNHCKSASCK